MRAISYRLIAALVSLTLAWVLVAQVVAAGATVPGNAAFERTWARTNKSVAEMRVSRTWIWGPSANTAAVKEEYAESPGGLRDVQYFDKARMEISQRNATDDGLWYVTTGLLAMELVTGQLQLGDDLFEARTPANINVAGDENDSSGPTYATFTKLLDEPPAKAGATLTQRLARDGTITKDDKFAKYGVTAAQHVEVPGIDHQIASPFWAFMNSSGEVYVDGHYVNEPIFEDPYYAIGYPLSEAYWATIKVAGTSHDVLMQVFQRRVLTYTPANPAGWQVEMGNIGRHYYAWRYAQLPTAPAAPTNVTLTASNPTGCTYSGGVATDCEYTLTLTWKDASNNEDGFKISTSFDMTTYTAATNATTWSKAFRLQPGKAVILSVFAWNKVGNSAAVASNAVTLAAPTSVTVAAPSNVKLQISAPSDCDLTSGIATECDYTLTATWTDNSSNEDGFEIRPDFSATTYKVAANVTTWSHEFSLEPREWVHVEVRAYNAAAQSNWVASENGYLHEPTPAAPAEGTLVVSDPSDCVFVNGVATECAYAITATWKDQSNNEDGFRVRPSFTTTSKRVDKDVTTWSGVFRLEPREWVSVEVQAYNSIGASAWVESEQVYLHEPTAPLAPTNVLLAISDPSDCTIVNNVPVECTYTLTLTWTDGSKNEDGFKITTSFDTTTYTVPANTTTWSKAFRLEPSKDVTLTIVAYNVVGSSKAIPSNKVTPLPSALEIPDAPKDVVLAVSTPYDCQGVSWLLTCKYDFTLTWKDMASDETSLTIRRLPDMIE
ncbi:MAG TPA: hypothetical protein VFV93_07620, partial [Thermomicrobiales bacterium]|nr:hypothetical protein [Thermomicrobiales bacterium]